MSKPARPTTTYRPTSAPAHQRDARQQEDELRRHAQQPVGSGGRRQQQSRSTSRGTDRSPERLNDVVLALKLRLNEQDRRLVQSSAANLRLEQQSALQEKQIDTLLREQRSAVDKYSDSDDVDRLYNGDSTMVATIRKQHERSLIVRRLREQIDSLRTAVGERDASIAGLRRSQRGTALLEVEAAKEEYFAEVLRLRKLLKKTSNNTNEEPQLRPSASEEAFNDRIYELQRRLREMAGENAGLRAALDRKLLTRSHQSTSAPTSPRKPPPPQAAAPPVAVRRPVVVSRPLVQKKKQRLPRKEPVAAAPAPALATPRRAREVVASNGTSSWSTRRVSTPASTRPTSPRTPRVKKPAVVVIKEDDEAAKREQVTELEVEAQWKQQAREEAELRKKERSAAAQEARCAAEAAALKMLREQSTIPEEEEPRASTVLPYSAEPLTFAGLELHRRGQDGQLVTTSVAEERERHLQHDVLSHVALRQDFDDDESIAARNAFIDECDEMHPELSTTDEHAADVEHDVAQTRRVSLAIESDHMAAIAKIRADQEAAKGDQEAPKEEDDDDDDDSQSAPAVAEQPINVASADSDERYAAPAEEEGAASSSSTAALAQEQQQPAVVIERDSNDSKGDPPPPCSSSSSATVVTDNDDAAEARHHQAPPAEKMDGIVTETVGVDDLDGILDGILGDDVPSKNNVVEKDNNKVEAPQQQQAEEEPPAAAPSPAALGLHITPQTTTSPPLPRTSPQSPASYHQTGESPQSPAASPAASPVASPATAPATTSDDDASAATDFYDDDFDAADDAAPLPS